MYRKEERKREREARERVYAHFKDPANSPQVLEAIEICDGHTIFDPQDFSMLPEFVRDHLSKGAPSEGPSGDPKRTIYTAEGPVTGDLFGIYGLDLLETVARAHGLGSAKNGRGFRANDLKEQIKAKLEPESAPANG